MERAPSDLHDSQETRRLLQQAAAGDRSAFDALFARNREPLRKLVELRLDPKLKRRVDPSDVSANPICRADSSRTLPQ